MKITRRKLRQLILKEASSLQMAQYASRSDDIMTVVNLMLSGIDGGLALMPGRQQLTDEESYEYGQDIRGVVESLPADAVSRLADVWREVKTGGGFEDPDGDVTVDVDEDDDWLIGAATKDKRPQYNWHRSRYKGK